VRIGALDMIRINVAPMNNVVPRDGADHALRVTRPRMRKVLADRSARNPQKRERGLVGLHVLRQRLALYTVKKPIRAWRT
jgi:hypothetical protein